jgi:hypothetical protein
MDDLDRLAFRMVRTIRNSYPHLIAQGFTLTDLEERLVPFRDARREMSNNGPEAWETTLLRMVSGERGYLSTDADLQLACRQALRLPSPTIALVRPWSATSVSLGPAALVLGLERTSTPRHVDAQELPREAELSTPRSWMHSGASPAHDSSALGLVDATHSLRLATPHAVGSDGKVSDPSPSSPVVSSLKCGCRFCDGRLPDLKRLTFCPHCGINLTVRHCPACSTELDVTWRFCVTCGRGSDVPELPESVTRLSSSGAS